MDAQIKTYSYPNGEIQRVQLIRLADWSQLEFLRPGYCDAALDRFSRIYRQYLVPACPWLFGNMVMFRIPEDVEVPYPPDTGKCGVVADRLTSAAAGLKKGVRIVGGKAFFRDRQTEAFWNTLQQRGCLRIVSGKLPVTTIIPVGDLPGFLTETEPDAALKVNASFFIMDRFDCATVYDHVGTVLGLLVKDGAVDNPPLFCREALLVRRDGSVTVETPDLRKMAIKINANTYVHDHNATIYSRPEYSRTPNRKGKKLVIVGCRVAAVCDGGSVKIPASGFVLYPADTCDVRPGDGVEYQGMEDVVFGIQVGNSILRNGIKTDRFVSRFYNIRRLEPVPFPPSLYPMDFSGSRAARIALGADKDGKPMLLWAEGAAKLGYVPGKDSCGASLREMAEICQDLGMVNGVNLDGGGSAQILLNNRRRLCLSDRNKEDRSEAERPVPMALMVR